jgi:sugar O-acyltransferase (sialic acid O-acetyltransferase NeuD family)
VTHFIEAPRLNVNDDLVTISLWAKPDRSLVRKGEVIAILETTKATFELESEQTGYLHIFAPQEVQVGVGEIVGAICEGPEEIPAKPAAARAAVAVEGAARKVTKKAEISARKAGLDLEKLRAEVPGTGVITELDIQGYLQRCGRPTLAPEVSDASDTVDDVYVANRQQRLLIIGGGLGAVQVLDSLTRIENQRATAIVDDNPKLHGKTVMGIPVLGGREEIEALFRQELFDAGVVSVSTSIDFRQRMFEKLAQLGIPVANVVDPTSRVLMNAVLGVGNVILAYCHIGSCAVVGNGNFLSPYVDIEHHCRVGDFCTFGPGVMMSSLVTIGDCVKFGTGIFIEPKLSIGANSIIGSGAILARNIPENSIVKTRVSYTIRPRN